MPKTRSRSHVRGVSSQVTGSFSEPILTDGKLYTTVVPAGAAAVLRPGHQARAWDKPVPAPATPGPPGPGNREKG